MNEVTATKKRKYAMHDGRFVANAVKVVETTLGKRLPIGAVVHHADGNCANDAKGNLVVCPSKAYHNLIHARMAAFDACGNANWMPCGICKKYDDPSNLYVWRRGGRAAVHRVCHAAKQLTRWRGDRTDIKPIAKKGTGDRYYSRIASNALGKHLPAGASIFRIGGNDGLVICPSDSYRKLLTVRLAALSACGNADWRKCAFCGSWDDPAKMYCGSTDRTIPQYHHRACRNSYLRRKKG